MIIVGMRVPLKLILLAQIGGNVTSQLLADILMFSLIHSFDTTINWLNWCGILGVAVGGEVGKSAGGFAVLAETLALLELLAGTLPAANLPRILGKH